jgi:hypothetical protein
MSSTRNSQVAAKNFQIRANDFSSSASAVTLKSYSQADNGDVATATYDLFFPAKNPVYKNGIGPVDDGSGGIVAGSDDLNPSNKSFMYNAVTQKYEWGDAGSAQLFIQGQTVTEHMDEHGSALTVAREVPLVPGDPGYVDPDDPDFEQKYKVEYKFTDSLFNMKSFQASKADVVRPQLSASAGLFFDWTSTPTTTAVYGGDGETYYTNDDKAKIDKVVLQTNQERSSTDIVFSASSDGTGSYPPVKADAGISNTQVPSNILKLQAEWDSDDNNGAGYTDDTAKVTALGARPVFVSGTHAAVVTDIVTSAAEGETVTHSIVTVTLDKPLADLAFATGSYIRTDTATTFTEFKGVWEITTVPDTTDQFTFTLTTPVAVDAILAETKATFFSEFVGFGQTGTVITNTEHGLSQDQYVKIDVSGITDSDLYVTDPVTLLKIGYNGVYKVTPVAGDLFAFTITFPTAPVIALNPSEGIVKSFADSPSKEVTKVELEPSLATLKHFSVDQTSSSFGAERNKLALSVFKDDTSKMTRLDSTMLPYESKWTFSKSTKLDVWNAIQPDSGYGYWDDPTSKVAVLGALTPPIVPPTSDEEDDETNEGFFCVDNAEKKLYTDMETIEFGPSSMRHRLFVGPDSDGNPRLYIQKYSANSAGDLAWIGADVVVDEYGQHSAQLEFSTNFIADSDDAAYDGMIDVTLTSLTGTLDHVHLYLDDFAMGSGPQHKILNEALPYDVSSTFTVVVVDTTATVTVTLTQPLEDVGISGIASGDFFTLASTVSPAFNGTHVVAAGADPTTSTFTFTMTTDAADPVTDGAATGATGKFIKATTKLDPVYAGVHKVVAYAAANDHARVSEFSKATVDTTLDTGASGVSQSATSVAPATQTGTSSYY